MWQQFQEIWGRTLASVGGVAIKGWHFIVVIIVLTTATAGAVTYTAVTSNQPTSDVHQEVIIFISGLNSSMNSQ